MKNRFALAGLLLAIGISAASAQSGVAVKQSGNVTPNTVPWWITSGVIGSGVTAVDSPISSFGATGPICSNSARQASGAWNSLCFQANTGSAATISLQNYGTASAQSLNLVINGQTFILPGGFGRERLSGARTYYVRVSGSDTNCSGLANVDDPNSGPLPRACAFATPQKPISVLLKSVDLSGFSVTIDMTGSFTTGILAAGVFVGSGNSVVGGASSVIVTSTVGASITTTDADAIAATEGAVLTVGGGNITLSTTGSKGNCLSAYNGGSIVQGIVTYGPAAGGHIQAGWIQTPSGLLPGPGTIYIANNYTIAGSAIFHWHVPTEGSVIKVEPGITVTITGTPAFSGFFAGITKGFINSTAPGVTFVGSATGPRFLIHNAGVITGLPTLPGSTPGTIAGLGTIATQVSEADTYTGIGNILGLVNPPLAAPVAGQVGAWFDSTGLRFHDIDTTGKIGTTVIGDAGAANNFITAIDPNTGVISKAQPTLSNLGGAGTGVLTALAINVGSIGAFVVNGGGAVAVAGLPTCNTAAKGAKYFVTDSNAASFTAGIGAVVAAGGSTNVPVVCDGTNWRIG